MASQPSKVLKEKGEVSLSKKTRHLGAILWDSSGLWGCSWSHQEWSRVVLAPWNVLGRSCVLLGGRYNTKREQTKNKTREGRRGENKEQSERILVWHKEDEPKTAKQSRTSSHLEPLVFSYFCSRSPPQFLTKKHVTFDQGLSFLISLPGKSRTKREETLQTTNEQIVKNTEHRSKSCKKSFEKGPISYSIFSYSKKGVLNFIQLHFALLFLGSVMATCWPDLGSQKGAKRSPDGPKASPKLSSKSKRTNDRNMDGPELHD